MKKSVIFKIIVFIVICSSVAFITNHMGNGSIVSVSAEMKNATLPVVYIDYDDTLVNMLHGYVNNIDMTLLRDAIVPISKEKQVKLWISSSSDAFDSFSYEVRSVDGSLVETGDITDVKEEEGYTKCTTTIRMDLAEGRDYYYVLLLTQGEQVIRYYTRIIIAPEYHTSELLDFVEKFHAQTFVKDEENSLVAAKLEPNASGNNNDLANVSIHSNYDTVTYAGMSPSVISQVIPVIQEISSEYCIFRLEFVIAAGDETITNYYNVTEYYKVTYVDASTIYLLDYHRTQNELYNYKNVNTTKNWFKIGVADDVSFTYLTSDDEKRVAFVREGQLWYYDYAKTNIIRIFGFWQEDYLDINNTYRAHNIHLLSMDDNGNIAFAVSGYMNRGNHEGHTGIAVYRYTAESNRTDELMFLEIALPYEQLSVYTERFMYLNKQDTFFFYLQGRVYRVARDGNMTEIATEIPISELAVSENYSRIAYPENSEISKNTKVIIMDLETENSTEYAVSDQERIKTIGFVDNDFVCGKAMDSDIVSYADGSVVFPMYKLEVIDMNKNVLKDYESQDMYIMNAYTSGLDIYFDKAGRVDGEYQVKDQDFITYKEADNLQKVSVIYRYSGTSLNLLYMVFPNYIYVKTVPKLLITKEIIRSESVDVSVSLNETETCFYVYNTRGLSNVYSLAAPALKDAFSNKGIVLNSKGEHIWENSSLPEYFTITEEVPTVTVTEENDSLSACMEMALRYAGATIDMAEINSFEGQKEQLFNEKLGLSGLRLTDVSAETMLYYLSNAVPVIARLQDDHYVLITSYNAAAIRYFDPVTGESIREDRISFNKKMEQAGGIYITYVPKK